MGVAVLSQTIALPLFDLSIIMRRVAKSNPDWDVERLCRAELEYRRFLFLCKEYPCTPLSPLRDVDEVWHAHILHTQDYAADCKGFLGRFLHHCPFNEKHPRHNKDRTAELYQVVYGVPYGPVDEVECCNCDAHEPGEMVHS